MFTLTASAAEHILRAARSQAELPDPPLLRVAAKYGDDGEIVYGMGFDEEREHDEVVVSAGVVVLIAPPSRELLDGATLDFVELHRGEFQFVFLNPQAEAPKPGCRTPNCGGCGGGRAA